MCPLFSGSQRPACSSSAHERSSRRDCSDPGGSGIRPESARRLGPCSGLRWDRQHVTGPRRPGHPAKLLWSHSGPVSSGGAPRLSRSIGWRPLRDVVRDGLCRRNRVENRDRSPRPRAGLPGDPGRALQRGAGCGDPSAARCSLEGKPNSRVFWARQYSSRVGGPQRRRPNSDSLRWPGDICSESR